MENIRKLPSLNAGDAIKSVLSNLTNFKGRARRSELWWYWLVYFLVAMILNFTLSMYLQSVISLLLQLTLWSVTVRRLHDRGHGGWWVAAAIIIGIVGNVYLAQSGFYEIMATVNPDVDAAMAVLRSPVLMILGLLSFIVNITIFVFCVLDGKPGDNKYGPSPKYVPDDK